MKKRLLTAAAACLLILILSAVFALSASADTEGYYTYTVRSREATIKDVDASISGDIEIPATLGGYPVTSIGTWAFSDCTSLTSITIPDSVTSIGNSAFWGCTSLESITIPEGVTSIGRQAFFGCSSLASITIPDSVTSIGEWAFSDCSSLTSITIPDSVTSIGEGAFSNCWSLTSITIPDSVISIGDNAFDGCTGLIQKENGVSYVDKWVIDCDTNVTSVSLRNNTVGIGGGAFSNCTSLSSITIPASVTSIDAGAFFGCTSLTSIIIPDSVTSIGGWVFENCTSLTSITIPDSVTSIGYYAFSSCTSLTSMTVAEGNTTYHSAGNCIIETATGTLVAGCKASIIPDDGSVTSIGNYAFSGCGGLTSITIPDSVTSIGEWAFSDCSSLTSVTFEEGRQLTSIGSSAFRYCTSLTSITFPEGVTSIGSNAFYYCTSLTSITIPDSVTSIGGEAFYYCTSLTSITIPDSVISIGMYAFRYCTSLTSITVAEGNTTYHSAGNCIIKTATGTLIAGCKASIIPDDGSVTSIGDAAFDGCSSLTSITIPEGVTGIGMYAFYGCSSLTIYAEAASKPGGWDNDWNPDDRPVVWGYKTATPEEPDVPGLLAAPSIGGTLDLIFALDSENPNAGILVNGVEANRITVAPQDADTAITVQAYVKVSDTEIVYGEEKTVTLNGILEAYLSDPAHAETAAAALAYTHAFKNYFTEGGVVADAGDPAEDYSEKGEDLYLIADTYTGEDKVGFRGVSLLLNDRVNIKVVAKTTDARYALEIASLADFSDAVRIPSVLTEDGSGVKFIMDGISAFNWNADYYFRLVDTENGSKVVSDTLRYGVAVYYARMAKDPAAPDNIKKLTATMMKLYEAVAPAEPLPPFVWEYEENETLFDDLRGLPFR